MKIGIISVNTGFTSAETIVEFAQKAEEVGLESVWTFEHTIIPLDYQSKYPYSDDGKMGGTPEVSIVDPLIALSVVAANTHKVRLGTGVNVLPQANPIYLAKQSASLDFMSGGRFMLGVGLGWLREEFDALGVPWERRGARFDDYVVAMRKMWSGEVVEHQSDFLSWSGFKSYPLPVQKPGIPVIMGGSAGKIFRRVAKLADGWFPATPTPDQLETVLPQLEAACAEEGRDRRSIEITSMWFPPMTGIDGVKQYEDLGVSRLVVPHIGIGSNNPVEDLERFADETLAKL